MIEKIEVKVPILKNINFFRNETWEGIELQAIKDIINNCNNAEIPFDETISISPIFKFINSDKLNQYDIKKMHRLTHTMRDYHMLVLKFDYNSIKIKNVIQCALEGNSDINETDIRSEITRIVMQSVEEWVFKLFLAFCVAYPGVISFGNMIINITDYSYISSNEYYSHFIQSAIDNSKNIGWPIIENLSIKKTVDWLFKRNEFLNMIGNNQIDKALIALSNTFYDDNNLPLQLMWTLLALENLYCTSDDTICDSLHNNTEIYLGSRLEYKKIIKNMYKIRSKFIHGNMAITSMHFPNESDKQIEKALELSQSLNIALSVLIATIQKVIKENREKLAFIKLHKLLD